MNPPPFSLTSSSVAQLLYFCVAKSGRIIHSHIADSHDDLQPLADRCIACAPSLHSLYFHTVADKTFAFLFEDSTTFFVIVDSSLGSAGALRLLHRLRDGFHICERNEVKEELIQVLRGLVQSLESISRPSDGEETPTPTPSPTKVPLLRNASSRGNAVRIDVQQPEAAAAAAGAAPGLGRSSSLKGRGRRVWCRHVKVVIAVDVVICLVLFGVWLGVCKGFQCLRS